MQESTREASVVHGSSMNLQALLTEKIVALNVERARLDIECFISNREPLLIWSTQYFLQLVTRIQVV